MNMKELNELEAFTVEEFQNNFDFLMNEVKNGASFVITSEHGNAVIVPYNETIKFAVESYVDDELIRLHTDHEEGS
jgi:hypothetical protein